MRARLFISRIRESKFGQLLLRFTPNSVRRLLKLVIFGNDPKGNDLVDKRNEQVELWIDAHFRKQGNWIQENRSDPPLFSIIIPVYKVGASVFRKLLDSLINQSFKNFEVCIGAHDTSETILEVLNSVISRKQININLDVAKHNKGISATSNVCLNLATGQYVVLLDHDDELPTHALNSLASSIEQNPESVMYYTDKRTISEKGQTVNVLLKPKWSPDILLSANYLTHLNAIKTSAVREVGGWDQEIDGAQDWDLFLRISLLDKPITHIPAISYSWRQVKTSVSMNGVDAKPYVARAQQKALQKFLDIEYSGASVQIDARGLPKFKWPSMQYIVAIGEEQYQVIRQQIQKGDSKLPEDTVFILGSANNFQIRSGEFSEIAGFLRNKKISCSTGIFVNSSGNVIDGPRVRLKDGQIRPIFWDVPVTHNGPYGFVGWIRNASDVCESVFAVRSRDLMRLAPECDEVKKIPEKLAKIGRLVSNPSLVIEIQNDAYGLPATGEIDDVYFDGESVMGLNEPQPKFIVAETHQPRDTYDQQASNFIRSLPNRAAFVNHAKLESLSKIAWLVPGFSSTGYGGIRSIFRFADYLAGLGIESDFYINGPAVSKSLKDEITRNFPGLDQSIFRPYSTGECLELGKYDLAVATLWTTAYDLAAAKGFLKRVYLVQDFEPDFYPSGSLKLLAFNSYKLGLHHITNTEGLAKVLNNNGIVASSFNPGLDFGIFNNLGRSFAPAKKVRIFFYMRPYHPRNCFDLNLVIIRQLKARFGDRIDVVCAGAEFNPSDYNIENLINYVGFIPYAETGDLYRSIDIGVSLMASSHPSYPPLEMMACGSVVVTNENPATREFFSSENSIVVSPFADEIVQKISHLIENPKDRRTLSISASRFAQESIPDWSAVCNKFHSLLLDSSVPQSTLLGQKL